ncbi:MAG: lamin tail domain-containing protein, partial [Patescibacteria group bacterium]|nr:lamin tail domain-containing protein [Patescibacteria group bacterium]
MKISGNKNQIFFIFIFILFFVLFFPSTIKAIPRGTILYKTSEDGKMYGYNNFDFSLITGKFYPGGVAIYIGRDKIKKEDMIVEVDYNGVRKIPAKYFVDLDKGEKFIGAKIPNGFKGISEKMAENIVNQYGENFDFTYHKQKGPQSGDWTSAGFVEKIYESAESSQLTYHQEPIWNYTYYSAFNITPDSYDNESEINNNHDCFSEKMEFSKIHKLGQGGFFERFFTQEAKSLVKAIQSSLSEAADEIINLNVLGKKYDGERYFFFPYTQFKQPSLQEVEIDIPVASHGKAQAVGELSSATLLRLKTAAFSERIIKELTQERIKKLAQDFVGLGKIIAGIGSIKETIGTAEEGIKLISGNKINIDSEKFAEEMAFKNKHISAALSWIEEAEEFTQASINESLEFFDLTNRGQFSGPEYKREMELELAKIGEIEEQVFENVNSKPETLEEEAFPVELTDLTNPPLEEIKLDKIGNENLFFTEEKIEDQTEIEASQLGKQKIKEPEKLSSQSLQYFFGDILINELMANPEVLANEWIELYNTTNNQISLNDWTIEDNTAEPKLLKDLIINPQSWLVLNKGQNFNFDLNNSGDIIKLKYKDVLIDQVCYGDFDDGNINDNAPLAAQGQSLAKNNNIWVVTTQPTPGMLNQIIAPSLVVQPQGSSGGEDGGGGGGGSS